MSFLNTTVISNTSLVRQTQRHIHCLFMAMSPNVPHKELMSICNTIDNLSKIDDLETLIKFANKIESFGIDQEIMAFELAQTARLYN